MISNFEKCPKWSNFKKLLPITMTISTFSMVGASKILFSEFPEIVLPVDTADGNRFLKQLIWEM
jgi:hypothetical protein